ncbi:hypothetical protein [Caudoviricetes sp.]|nr:hypothetical protein [Caudoviricetes sp.]
MRPSEKVAGASAGEKGIKVLQEMLGRTFR